MADEQGQDQEQRRSRYEPSFCEIAQKAVSLGATMEEVAEGLGVDVRTVYAWRNRHPEFHKATIVGAAAYEKMTAEVETSLYRRAVGYDFPACKIFNDGGKPLIVEYTEHVPPSVEAQMFWLKNRKSHRWRDRLQLDLTLPKADEIRSVIEARRARADIRLIPDKSAA